MTRQELEERLLDYLYDELDERERAAFERALPQHPEVEREVAAHRTTRRAYAALPREAAPAGLLDGVLAEAEREAARRTEAAAPARAGERGASGAPSFWERVRRVLFQPAFAMAMVVLVVAGVSLVATRKGELPGMGPASEAQHLPPVAVHEEPPHAAEPRVAATPTATPEVAEQPASAVSIADRTRAGAKDDSEDESGREPANELAADRPAKKLDAPASEPATFALRTGNGATGPSPVAGANADRGSGGKAKGTADAAPKDLLAKVGDMEGDLDRPSEDEAPAGASPAPTREDAAGGEGKPAEAPPAPGVPATNDGLRDTAVVTDSGSTDKRTGEKRVAPASKTPAPEPTTPSEAEERQVPAAAPKREAERVATTEVARSPAPTPDIDDDGKREPQKAPALTPPSSPEQASRLWTTYQQQVAAGAWADAQRSIDALARLEGESARVKQARADLKKRMAETGGKASPGADKIPPDPPVQPPK